MWNYALPDAVKRRIAQLRKYYAEPLKLAAQVNWQFGSIVFLDTLFQALQQEVGRLIQETIRELPPAEKVAATVAITRAFPELAQWHLYAHREFLHRRTTPKQKRTG